VCACWWLASAPDSVLAAAELDARTVSVERWLKAVLRHEPGVVDDAVAEIRSWSVSQLETLEVDESVLVQLMRDPTLSSFTFRSVPAQGSVQPTVDCLPCLARSASTHRSLKPPQRIPYTAPQLRRLKVLACSAAGLLNEPPCQALHWI
jgi:hypothetical protein